MYSCESDGKVDFFVAVAINQVTTTTTTTTTVLRPFVRDYPDDPVPEETFTHPPS